MLYYFDVIRTRLELGTGVCFNSVNKFVQCDYFNTPLNWKSVPIPDLATLQCHNVIRMDVLQIREQIGSYPLLKGFSDDEIDGISKIVDHKDYSLDEVIFNADTSDSRFFVVSSGGFSLTLSNGAKRTYRPGEMFGEQAAFSSGKRLGTVVCTKPGRLFTIRSEYVMADGVLLESVRVKLLALVIRQLTNYLQEYQMDQIEPMIRLGESETMEFKKSTSLELKRAGVRSLGAFMNAKGGSVLFGIHDDGEVLGISETGNVTYDKFVRDMMGLIRSRLGTSALYKVGFDRELVKGKAVYRMFCPASLEPILHTSKAQGETYYVRQESTNRKYSFYEALLNYAERRKNHRANNNEPLTKGKVSSLFMKN